MSVCTVLAPDVYMDDFGLTDVLTGGRTIFLTNINRLMDQRTYRRMDRWTDKAVTMAARAGVGVGAAVAASEWRKRRQARQCEREH